ncbi:MAG: OB-fold nucleic acid binding domain-containing protein, partial [Thermoanaerobaculales bacterium]|nr:OB-fold nucleic acid binding domain-containing protein [Thermoanaerobaculales bacterium]
METKDESQQPVEQLIANRRAKLDALREMGEDPYPRRFRVERSVSEARSLYEGLSAEELEKDPPVVRLGGRLRAVRGHGKVSFADLSDGAGQIQLYLK